MHLAVEGEVDRLTAPDLFDAIVGAVQCDVDEIDVDMSGVWFCDAGGVNMLVRAQRAVHHHRSLLGCRAHLRLVHPSREVSTVLRAAGVEGALDVVEDPAPPVATRAQPSALHTV